MRSHRSIAALLVGAILSWTLVQAQQPKPTAPPALPANVAPAQAAAWTFVGRVLLNLDEAMRVEVVRKLAEMRQFSPEMAQKVALVLHNRMKGLGTAGRETYSGFKAVADILNGLDQGMSKGILEKIEAKEPELAIGIRNLMFTFEDLVTVPMQSIRELVGAADKKVLAMALKGAQDNVKAHIFQAMSSRERRFRFTTTRRCSRHA